MKELYRKFSAAVDAEALMKNTETLWRIEYGQTVSCWHKSAAKTVEILKENGIPHIEKITFPADGKTAYQDKTTPLGWEATVGKLTVLKGYNIPPGFVAADYQQQPFQLIKGSTATAPGGEILRILTDEQLLAGADPHDALILVPPPVTKMQFNNVMLQHYLDLGARGIVDDFAINGEESPDTNSWRNSITEGNNWHVIAGERPFIGFCVTPRTGKLLRESCANGEVLVRAESDGRRFESTVDVVTACVPGKRKEEFWIFAHLYEPLANDNSSGVAAAIETARLIMQQGTPEFSLRVIFGLEHYGFAAYASTRGENLSSQVIGGIDYDAMYLRKEWSVNFNCAAPGTPFFGNRLFRQLADALKDEPGVPEICFRNSFPSMYDDDSFLGDSTTGVPTVWPIRTGHSFWHNSFQTIDYVEKEAFACGTAIHTAFVASVLFPDRKFLAKVLTDAVAELDAEQSRTVGSAKEHLTRRYDILQAEIGNFERCFDRTLIEPLLEGLRREYEKRLGGLSDEIPHSTWRDYAEQIIPSRLTTGLPYDLARLPLDARKPLPNRILYGPLAAILSDMDGKRNLAEIFRMVEHEICREMPEKEIASMLRSVLFLANAGYVSLNGFKGIGKAEIVASLRRAGIKEGDFLLIHSSLAAFGLIDGGPETVVAAFREAVGESGTILFPALSATFVFLGGPQHAKNFYPFDKDNFKSIWTGALPRYILSHYPECADNVHATHRWFGFGRLAKEACSQATPYSAPCGPDSPPMFALRQHGKVVHFGNTVGSTTFLHCLEDQFKLPGLENSFVKVKRGEGWEYQMVPDNLPGHRDFYQDDENKIKFFRAAMAKGLQIRKEELGPGTIRVMELDELQRIGSELVQQDPFILLCDSEECLSCKRLKRAWKK